MLWMERLQRRHVELKERVVALDSRPNVLQNDRRRREGGRNEDESREKNGNSEGLRKRSPTSTSSHTADQKTRSFP